MKNPFKKFDKRLRYIERLLLDLKDKSQKKPQPAIETPILINEVVKLTGLTKSTIYGYAQRNEICYHKKFGRLYFFKSEINEMIKTGKQRTLKELGAEADAYLSNKNKGLKK